MKANGGRFPVEYHRASGLIVPYIVDAYMAFSHELYAAAQERCPIGPVTQHLQKKMAAAVNSLVSSKCQLFKVSRGKSAEISG